MKKTTSFFLALTLCTVAAGCARYPDIPPGTIKEIPGPSALAVMPEKKSDELSVAFGKLKREPIRAPAEIGQASPVVEQETIKVPLSPEIQTEQDSYDYRVGPGDVLAIYMPGVAGRMRAESPEKTEKAEEETIQRFRVYGSGRIHLPLIGPIQVGDLTLEEIQEKIQSGLGAYIKEPFVTVEIAEYKSKPIYLLGKFITPGVNYLDRPINLLQGIVLGGGLQDAANLRGARLVRKQRIVPVDIYELLYHSDMRQNVQLHAGDTVYVPGNEQQNVFILGAVNRQGPVPMINGRLDLTQALSTSGLGEIYDQRHIRIIRSHSPTRGELLVVDMGRIMNGEALPFPLQDGDVVYVPRSGIADWNQALSQILPTLQAFSAIMQPFVQLKFLFEED